MVSGLICYYNPFLGTSSLYSTVSFSTFLEDDESDDFYSSFTIQQPSTLIPYTGSKTPLHTPSASNSIDQAIEGSLTRSSLSSASSDDVHSMTSSKLTSSAVSSTVLPIGPVQEPGNVDSPKYTS